MAYLVEKRFGKNNARMSSSYTELVFKLFKGMDIKCSLDFMSKLETSNFNYILTDFTNIGEITIFTDKCGLKELSRHDEQQRRQTNRVFLQDFLNKG